MALDGIDTAVVIVNYRTRELTCAAVKSVADEPGVCEIVVVDNASGDGSVEFFERELLDERVRIVESAANVGFGQGVNLGVEHCTAPLLLLLNSDATLVPGSLAPLTQTLLEDSSVAVVAPAVYAADTMELQWGAYGVFPTLKAIVRRTNTNPPETVRPDWVSGVGMLVRRSDFQSIGGFDRDFVMYLEDVDLCRRFRDAGRQVRRELRGGVIHAVGQSWEPIMAGDEHARRRQVDWAHQSRVRYYEKAGHSRVEQRAMMAIRFAHLLAARAPWRRPLRPKKRA